MAESLPLGIHRVYTPSRENVALVDEPLPVDLVLVLLLRVGICHLENLDQLSNSEASSLPRKASTSTMMRVNLTSHSIGAATCMLWRAHWVSEVGVVILMKSGRALGRGIVVNLCQEVWLRGEHLCLGYCAELIN